MRFFFIELFNFYNGFSVFFLFVLLFNWVHSNCMLFVSLLNIKLFSQLFNDLSLGSILFLILFFHLLHVTHWDISFQLCMINVNHIFLQLNFCSQFFILLSQYICVFCMIFIHFNCVKYILIWLADSWLLLVSALLFKCLRLLGITDLLFCYLINTTIILINNTVSITFRITTYWSVLAEGPSLLNSSTLCTWWSWWNNMFFQSLCQ